MGRSRQAADRLASARDVAHACRQKHATGDVIVVRFADDIALGFQVKSDAERFWVALAERFRKFHLELHPEKTRLLEFGPYAADHRKARGQGKPETFNFLGYVAEIVMWPWPWRAADHRDRHVIAAT